MHVLNRKELFMHTYGGKRPRIQNYKDKRNPNTLKFQSLIGQKQIGK